MPHEVGKPDRTRLPDHQAEDPVPARRRADSRPELRRDTVCSEAFEQAPIRREHANGRVARADELGGGLDYVLEHAFDRYFSYQG